MKWRPACDLANIGRMKRTVTVIGLLLVASVAQAQEHTLARQVEIRRTTYGVPHIRAQNFKALGYALGYVQMEDYGQLVPHFLVNTRGELAREFGRDSIEADFRNRANWLDATRSFPLLDTDTRDVYEGFAAGVNDYIRLHRTEFASWIEPNFTAIDALATDMELPSERSMRRMLRREAARGSVPADERGSNAWALAPARTTSGKAILLRNPHLDWDAGYYEVHLTIPGVLDFYADIQIGGPFRTVGGFNARLGWATTNNNPDIDEVYAIAVDPGNADNILFDNASIPLRRETLSIPYKTGDTLAVETRELLYTPIGPVVQRANGKVYVWKYGGAGDYRLGQMWLRMMRARTLAEWKDAMRMLAKPYSNFTYADADGNIFYVWGGQLPQLPVKSGGDTMAVAVTRSSEVWQKLIPFDALPQLLNPRGGYIHNENDPFHFTNLNEVLTAERFPAWFPKPRLGLRSQHALQLIGGKDKLSLEDVIARKHSVRMLLADRLKPDLIAAVQAANPVGEVAAALEVLRKWDNTVAPESRGGVLFETWWERYFRSAPRPQPGTDADSVLVTHVWNMRKPTATPEGIASPQRAAEAFAWAVTETKKQFGAVDVAWGEVHRVRRGNVDVPVGGCAGTIGCFRVLWFQPAPDGKRVASGGDGWIFAVEFGKVPRAYSVLAYGNSAKPDSPFFSDQAAMFARGELKPVQFTERDIERATIRRYRPGLQEAAN